MATTNQQGKHAKKNAGSRFDINSALNTNSKQYTKLLDQKEITSVSQIDTSFPKQQLSTISNTNNGSKTNTYTDASRYSRQNYGNKYHRHTFRNAIFAALGVLILSLGVIGITAKLTYDAAKNLEGEVQVLISELTYGDPAQATESARKIENAARRMRNLTNNPFWGAASIIPIIGNDFTVGRIYCAALDDFSSDLLIPTIEQLTATSAGPIIREDASFNANALQIILESVDREQKTIIKYDKEIARIGVPYIGRLANLHKQGSQAFPALSSLAVVAGTLAQEIHYLLGADGSPRSYTIMALNNSERHASGGLVGSFGGIVLNDGTITLEEFNPYKVLGNYASGYEANDGGGPDLTAEEINLFGRMNAFSPCDVTNNPDFPRAAINFTWMCQDNGFNSSDGVIALDPTVLQEVLRANNVAVTLDNGVTIDGNTAAKYLLHEVYISNSATEQDEIFSNAVNLTFDALFNSPKKINLVNTCKVIWESNKRHLQTWFPNSNLQEAFAMLGFSGEITHDATKPILGVYVNDQTWSKISWYLDITTSIESTVQNPDGSTSYQVETVLHNTLSEKDIDGLPAYVFGYNKRKRSHDDMINCIYLFAPEGGAITNVQSQGSFMDPALVNYTSFYPNIQTATMQEGSYEGLDVWFGYTCMQMGDSIKIDYTVTTSPQAQDDLELDCTPDTDKYK